MSTESFLVVRIAISVLAMIGLARDVGAATPQWSLREYVQTTWTHRNGVPLAPLLELTQTADGYLWFISQRMLVRFDGIEFVPIPLPCDRVQSLERGDHGSLWVLCREPGFRLFRRTNNGLLTEVPLTGLRLQGGPGLFLDSRGRLWIVGSVVARLEPDGRLREVYSDFDGGVTSPAEDAEGAIWLTTTSKIVRIEDERIEELPINGVFGLERAPDGGMFACGPPDRVRHLAGAKDTRIVQAPPGVSFVDASHCMAVDTTGGLWIGTRQHGIALIQNGRVETSLARNELGGSINDVFADGEDNVWVASSAGLHRFRKPHARLLSSIVPEVPPNPMAVFVDSRDDIWVKGIDQFVRLNLASPLHQIFHEPRRPRAFGEDETGRIWLATEREIGYLEGRTFRPVRDATGAPVPNVWAFSQDGDGHLWAVAKSIGIYQVTPGPPRRIFDEPAAAIDLRVSSQHGVVVTLLGGGVKQYLAGREHIYRPTEQEAANRFVRTILEDEDAIWMGDDRGLSRWRGGQVTRWTSAHGLPGSGAVQEIARDRLGRLWLMTNGGLIVLSTDDLAATPDGAPRSLRFVQIGSLDRVVPHPTGPDFSPRVSADRDGRLYFATNDSVAMVDPAAVTPSSLRPSIVLESVIADNEPVDPAASRLIAPSRLQFGYTSLSLRSPENIRFRYRLEGYDDDWIEAGSARHATYGTLRPGSYRFHVIGSGSEGVWNEDGAAFAFEIVPLFYNTWWFRGIVLVMLATAIAATHRLRVRRLTQQMNLRFEERLAERTRIARDLHDTLLQGALAASLHMQLADDALTEVPSSPPVEQTRAPLRRAIQLLSQLVDEGRATLRELRAAPAATDLADVLYHVARDQPNHSDIAFRVIVDGSVRPLKPDVADEIGWVAREAIVNAYRHSRARHIEAELLYTRTHFRCIVRDDGQGIDEGVLERGRDGHWGLTGMRERAERAGGKLHVRTRATAGTEVELSVKGRLAYSEPTRHPHD